MPIEGRLQDLEIHEIFQLLDLGSKTGVLRVSSVIRDNAGHVTFQRGAVVAASVQTNPHPLGLLLLREGRISADAVMAARSMQARGDARRLGELLIELGAITPRDLAHYVRRQIEEVIFELLSWKEGTFSFTEHAEVEVTEASEVRIPAGALLMEASRRLDAWSAIGAVVRDADAVPRIALSTANGSAPIDLGPDDWSVLAEIDGVRNIRQIAASLGADEFDVAKSVHGMVMTALIEVDR